MVSITFIRFVYFYIFKYRACLPDTIQMLLYQSFPFLFNTLFRTAPVSSAENMAGQLSGSLYCSSVRNRIEFSRCNFDGKRRSIKKLASPLPLGNPMVPFGGCKQPEHPPLPARGAPSAHPLFLSNRKRYFLFDKKRAAAKCHSPFFCTKIDILTHDHSANLPVGVMIQSHAGLLACASTFCSPSQVCFSVDMNKTTRLQRRARAGLSPASLLAA